MPDRPAVRGVTAFCSWFLAGCLALSALGFLTQAERRIAIVVPADPVAVSWPVVDVVALPLASTEEMLKAWLALVKTGEPISVPELLPPLARVTWKTTELIPLPRKRPARAIVKLTKLEPITEADKPNIFKAYQEGLLRPVGNCKEYETVDIRVRRLVSDAAAHFGSVALLSSCYRSVAYNKMIYERRGQRPTNSQHSKRKALDFKIAGVARDKLYAFVKRHPLMQKIGGIGRYSNNQIVHVDSGPKREWCWGCGGKRHRSKTQVASL